MSNAPISEFIIIDTNFHIILRQPRNGCDLTRSSENQIYIVKRQQIIALDWSLTEAAENKYAYLNTQVNFTNLVQIDSIGQYDMLLFDDRLDIFDPDYGLEKSIRLEEQYLRGFFTNLNNEIILQDGTFIWYLNLQGELVKQTIFKGVELRNEAELEIINFDKLFIYNGETKEFLNA